MVTWIILQLFSYGANCAHPICCCGWYTRDDDDHGDYRSVLTDMNHHRDNPDLCTVLGYPMYAVEHASAFVGSNVVDVVR